MTECLAKVLKKLAEDGKLQSTLTVLDNATSISWVMCRVRQVQVQQMLMPE